MAPKCNVFHLRIVAVLIIVGMTLSQNDDCLIRCYYSSFDDLVLSSQKMKIERCEQLSMCPDIRLLCI